MKSDDTKGQVRRVNNADAAGLYDNGGRMSGDNCNSLLSFAYEIVTMCLFEIGQDVHQLNKTQDFASIVKTSFISFPPVCSGSQD